MRARIDTQAVGLDAGLAFIRWMTGAENLHYGLWDGLEPCAGNLGRAQEAYTAKLLSVFPPGSLRILDIGGGAGELARRLISLGHQVEIVVPSAYLAARCRVNAPQAVVHECRFEEFTAQSPFDLCLFAESYQYIPLEQGLPRALAMLAPGGQVLIADCFRSAAYGAQKTIGRPPGGGHRLASFREGLERWPVQVLHEEEITRAVAPSIDLEQGLFLVMGLGIDRMRQELSDKRPVALWVIRAAFRLVLSARRRANLTQRLTARNRTSAAFETYNHYMIFRLAPKA